MTGRPSNAHLQAAKDEFIGRRVTINSATDPTLVGVTGEVLDETMKTFTLQTTNDRRITVAKAAVTLGIDLDGRVVEIDGNTLLFRPEDRIKKVRQTRSTTQSR